MIGIFGGSFNPIHLGHTNLASWIVAQGFVDEVWLMVSPHNPLKPRSLLADEQERFALARLAVKNVPHVSASNFEFSLPRPSFTWRTLEALGEEYPDERFALIVGADNWLHFDRWARHESLLRRYPIFVYPRVGCQLQPPFPRGVTFMPAPLFPQSSTAVREALRQGRSTEGLLDPDVARRIKQRGLYCENLA